MGPEVVDLSCLSGDEDDDDGGAAAVAPANKPASPSLMERMKAAIRATGLGLLLAPSYGKVTDEVLRGELTFVALPLAALHWTPATW